jgi:hypothetical protein
MRRFLLAVSVLILFTILPAAADPPPAPWVARDIGEPGAPGSTDVTSSPTGELWTVLGSGAGIFSLADSFHFVYQPVRGDASFSARFVYADLLEGDANLAAVGLMVRADGAPESPNLFYAMSAGSGLIVTSRDQPGGDTSAAIPVGARSTAEVNLGLRLQRLGDQITGFYSRDGLLWSQAAFPPRELPALGEQPLWGLAVTSHLDGGLIRAGFDRVDLRAGPPAPYSLLACGADRQVQLQWPPLPGARGYFVYRGPAGATAGQLARLTTGPVTADPVAGASFTDVGGALVNAVPYTYAVQGLFSGAGNALVAGPLVAVPAIPVVLPPDWSGCSVREPRQVGMAAYNPIRRTYTVRGSGGGFGGGFGGIGLGTDEFYCVAKRMDGDLQATVTLTRAPSGNGLAMLMLRERLDPGARYAAIGPTSNGTLLISRRAKTNGNAANPPATTTLGDGVRAPVTLRLVRKGDTITWLYSTDAGVTFRSPGPPVTFSSLSQELYVGLAVTARNRDQVSEAEFANLILK